MFRFKIRKCNQIYRNYSTKISNELSATNIRQTFLDFFINEHKHRLIRSSPVTPYCDPTVPFVNAGMNQFKNIFLGKSAAPCERAANSQKCIRISGKHNDLNIIGTDGYHHTFFEMLGNWSFGDYYKEKACNLAWDLLTKSYMIDPNRLYVTYFGGDEAMGLKPDLECREIWRSIGVPDDHILPFGAKDNFWEMGLSGPCGPCTEIHIDHLPNSEAKYRAKFVNAGVPDLTELWNVVFIEYNRKLDGTLEPLHEKYVDTGMGFERLVAVMQGKSSNYDTDLFIPIFNAISKETKMPPYNGIYDVNDSRYVYDYAYRVVADHTRMCSICIADGMYPQTSHRLRKIARKTMNMCADVFKNEKLIENVIVPEIVNILGPVYPELQKNYNNIRETFKFENENYKSAQTRNRKEFHALNISADGHLCENDTIDFAAFSTGFREVEKLLHSNEAIDILPIDFMYERLHVNAGLTVELIEKIAKEKGLLVDLDAFAEYKQKKQYEAKMSRQGLNSSFLDSLDTIEAQQTDYSFMYDYSFDNDRKQYNVKSIQAHVKMIKSSGDLYHIVLDKTNFYHTAGGQDADIGHITDANGCVFIVETVEMHKGYVFHIGHFQAPTTDVFHENQTVELHVNPIHRTGLSQHHTAMHLLQAALKHVTGQITYQQSSHVSASEMKCEIGTIGNRIDMQQLSQIEQVVRDIIQAKVPIETHFLSAHDLYALDNVTTIPGEVYPDENVRVLKMKNQCQHFESIEPCCGTHAHNTGELDDLCITSFKFNGSTRSYNINAIAGQIVSVAKENERNFMEKFEHFKNKIQNDQSQIDWKTLEANAIELTKELDKIQMSYITKAKIVTELDDLKKNISIAQRAQLRETVITEMTNVLAKRIENNAPFVIHVLNTTDNLEDSLLTDAEHVCHDLPVILLNVSNNKLNHGRASIPIKYTTNKFNAKHWLDEMGKALNIKCQSNKKKKQFSVCRFIELPQKEIQPNKLNEALELAKMAARNAFTKMVNADQSDRQAQEDDLSKQVDNVKRNLENENNLANLIRLETETKEIRNHMKNNLFLFTTKKKFIAELSSLDEKIFEARSNAEKNIVSSTLNDSSLENQPYIIQIIKTEHLLGNHSMMHATDLRNDIPIVVINVSDVEVIGRASIPSKYTNDDFNAKHLAYAFISTFDGKCVHDGTRYDTSVCDFRLSKNLVNDKELTNIFEKVKDMIENCLGK